MLNALQEVHLLLAEGANNQYGDLPWTAKQEMLMQQWLLARPEFCEFLPTRIVVLQLGALPQPLRSRQPVWEVVISYIFCKHLRAHHTRGEREHSGQLLAGVARSALTEGVKFLYQQADEILSSWWARRRDASALPPRKLPAPQDVTVGGAEPVSDPPTDETVDRLQELKDLAEPIKDGVVDIDNPAARKAIAELRELVEAILQTQITCAGEGTATLANRRRRGRYKGSRGPRNGGAREARRGRARACKDG